MNLETIDCISFTFQPQLSTLAMGYAFNNLYRMLVLFIYFLYFPNVTGNYNMAILYISSAELIEDIYLTVQLGNGLVYKLNHFGYHE